MKITVKEAMFANSQLSNWDYLTRTQLVSLLLLTNSTRRMAKMHFSVFLEWHPRQNSSLGWETGKYILTKHSLTGNKQDK